MMNSNSSEDFPAVSISKNAREDLEIINEKLISSGIISSISAVLVNYILENKAKNKRAEMNDILSSKKIPLLTIEEYLIRIVKYTKLEIPTLVCVFIYVLRLIAIENLIIGLNNIYRILIGFTVLAIKYNEDKQFKNFYYAKICGITVNEMNSIEYELFMRLGFNLVISEEEYNDIFAQLL